MGFTSYAQNFEDVMLWRALGHITDGVYVDVGAQHPRIDSISRAFYERGWRGVHIEPVPAFANMLREDRPDETVLQVALGEREGTLALNVFADTGLSTAIASYAERHQAERNYQVQHIEVPMLTLRSALGSVAGKQVHWLKIDVEGFEEQVLRGWDSQQLRPWILVVEATVPNSTETDYIKWDHLVTGAGYRFVYFDGLNRFYIANEHPELEAAFGAPPNVFDVVEVSGLASWGLCNFALAEHQGRIKDLTERLGASEAEAAAAGAHAAALEAQLAALDVQIAAAGTRMHDLETTLLAATSHTHELEGQLDRANSQARHHEAGRAAAEAMLAAAEARLAEAGERAREDEERIAVLSEQIVGAAAAAGAQKRLKEVESMLRERERQFRGLNQDLDASRAEVERLKHDSYYWWHTAEELRKQAGQLQNELLQVYNSKSWRLSAPLRIANAQGKRVRSFAGRAARWILRQPARVRGTVHDTTGAAASKVQSEVVVVSQAAVPATSRRLSPRAARLYAELKQIVEKGRD